MVGALTHQGAQRFVDSCPGAVLPPGAKIPPDGAPRWEIMGQCPPGTAVAEHIPDTVEHLSQVYAPRPAPGLGRGQQRGEHPPLGRGQIAGIWFPRHIPVVYAKSPHFSHRLSVTCGSG